MSAALISLACSAIRHFGAALVKASLAVSLVYVVGVL